MTWRQYGGSFDNPINPEFEQEARLVEQSRAGSERAFSALLARYQQPVFRLILYLVGDEEEARELTRISIKNALLHMPSVPSGYSIRPWLLRVAVLVALDSVRERGQSPEDLLSGLQLPAPAGPPRIVDADPADSDTMSLNVAQINAARQRETALADPWDELPLETERELIRLLLAGLPEGDAELLALGVVGQVPTRDLSALAGTSQRSVRRRIARALILFQSRYNTVRHDGLPSATREEQLPPAEPAARELPASKTTATPSSPLVERARKGLADATDLVRRGIQSVRQGMGVSDAEDRLRTLRTSEVPAADIVPPSPDIPPATDFESSATYQPFSLDDAESPETSPLSGAPPEDLPPGTFDAQSNSRWTAPAPSRDVIEHDTIPAPPLSDIPERDTVPPLSRASYGAATQPVDLPESSQMSIPLISEEAATALHSPEPGSTAPGRHLPRFGPPPEDVLVGMPPTVVPDAEQPAPVAATVEPDEPFTVAAAEPVEPTVLRSGRWDDVTLVHTPSAPAEAATPETPASHDEVAAPETPASRDEVAAPETPADVPATPAMETSPPAELAEHDDAVASDEPPIVAAPPVVEVVDPLTEIHPTMGDVHHFMPAESAVQSAPARDEEPVAESLAAPVDASVMQQGTDLADVSSAATLHSPANEDAAPPAPADIDGDLAMDAPAVTAQDVAPPSEAVMNAIPDTQFTESAPSNQTDAESAPAPADPSGAEPHSVAAIERMQGTGERPQHPLTGTMGSTSVMPSSARGDYMSRHRPSWLDAGDVGSIPGVQIDPGEVAEDVAVPLAPTAPPSGALTLPAQEAAVPAADAAPADMADLADLTAPPTDGPDSTPESPEDSQAPKRLRTPSRPMPRLERDIIDPPQER